MQDEILITYEMAQSIGLIPKPIAVGMVRGKHIFDRPSHGIHSRYERENGLVLCETDEKGCPKKAIPNY